MSETSQTSADKNSKLAWVAVATGAMLLVGLAFSPTRVWSNLFVGTFYLLTICLGGTVFIALSFVSGAGWNVAFRRVPEALAMLVPILGVVILIVLAPRMNHYQWHHHGHGDAGTFWFKQLWLTPSFWLFRSFCYVTIWSLVGWSLVARSRKQDSTAETQSNSAGIAAFFLVLYAITFSLASVDWIMALEPMWFSTMWGVYNFAGMILATVAAVVVFSLLFSTPGRPLHSVFSTEHLHDLGRLLLGFSCFWMYIWFSQYMLIWYSNIPEETSYFIVRTHGPWGPIVIVSILLNWLVPFFILLPRSSKRSRSVMMKVAVVLLIGRWVDVLLMVFPPTVGETPVFGIWEAAGVVCVTTAGVYLVNYAFKAAKPVPKRDPYLKESLNYHAC